MRPLPYEVGRRCAGSDAGPQFCSQFPLGKIITTRAVPTRRGGAKVLSAIDLGLPFR